MELEVLEIRENTVFVGRALGLFEGKKLERWREVPKALPNVWHELGYLEIIYSKFLEVRECGKV